MSKRQRELDYVNDDDDAAPDYSGLDRLTDADAYEPPTDGIRLQTLAELRQGVNTAAAKQEQEEQVFGIALAANFSLVRLNHTSGAPHPSIFNTETCSLYVYFCARYCCCRRFNATSAASLTSRCSRRKCPTETRQPLCTAACAPMKTIVHFETRSFIAYSSKRPAQQHG